MPNISINLKHNPYKVFIKKGIASEIPKHLKWGKKYAVVTDNKVSALYGKAFVRFLKKNGIEAELFSFAQGEKSKILPTIEKIANQMVKKNFDRKDAIIALGGGVVGDLAGFLASMYMRGIPYIQIPTTLLAMVDSSIGGKTGVDMQTGKNLLGRIEQPKAVFVDSNYLKTLAKKQVRNGLAEIIKYGVIKDPKLFTFIEKNSDKIFDLDEKAIDKIISTSVKIKGKIVEKDEHESGLRMILNYGHTYGHAIEKMSGYKLLHGYAISIGMVIANKIAVKKGMLKKEDSDRIKALLSQVELPIVTIKKPSNKDLMSDKKRQGDHISLILPTKIGKVKIVQEKCQ